MYVFRFLSATPTDTDDGSASARKGRRDRDFWTFQAIFWVSISVAMLGLTKAFRSDLPTLWGTIATRATFGLVTTTGIHWIVSAIAARSGARTTRWTIAAIRLREALGTPPQRGNDTPGG